MKVFQQRIVAIFLLLLSSFFVRYFPIYTQIRLIDLTVCQASNLIVSYWGVTADRCREFPIRRADEVGLVYT